MTGVVLWAMGTGWYAFEKSNEYQRFVLVKMAEASFKADTARGTSDPLLFRTPDGRQYWTSRSEEHTSELQSLMRISYAVFCLKKKTKSTTETQDAKHHRMK